MYIEDQKNMYFTHVDSNVRKIKKIKKPKKQEYEEKEEGNNKK